MTDNLPKLPTLDQRIRQFEIRIEVGAGKFTIAEDGWVHDAYRVRLTRPNNRPMTLTFRKGTGHHGSPPTITEVLESVIWDAQSVENADGFEDWASDFGYDTDSRKAEALYKACVKQSGDFKKMVGPEAYDVLLNDTELEG